MTNPATIEGTVVRDTATQVSPIVGSANAMSSHVAAVPAAVSPPARMLELAIERGADLDRLQQLMDLQERYEANEARKAFVLAMTQFKQNPPRIAKDKQVSFATGKGQTEYRHATLGAVCDAAIAGLAKVGISHRWEVEQNAEGWIVVTCVLTHAQGHSERTTMRSRADESGGKNSIQAIASATSYLQRYTLLAATGLATHDQDDDGKGGPGATISSSQVLDLDALISEVGANRAAFLKYCKVERLEDLPASKFQRAVAALRARGAA